MSLESNAFLFLCESKHIDVLLNVGFIGMDTINGIEGILEKKTEVIRFFFSK